MSSTNPDLDADALFAALEAETDLDDPSINPSYRASRLQQLSNEITQSKQNNNNTNLQSSSSSSNYETLTSDPEVLTFTTTHPRTLVHFFHPDFSRCSIMDTHLSEIARLHPPDEDGGEGRERTMFGRVDVRNADFVVQKLGVRVLPCVVGFVDGQVRERVTGFEGVSLGGKESGKEVTRRIEGVFVEKGVIGGRRVGRSGGDGGDGEGSDIDEEEEEERRRNDGRRGIKGPKQKLVDSDDDWD